MERIKQAIEKNKKNNPGLSGRTVQARADINNSGLQASQTPEDLENMQYKQTSIIKLSVDHLDNHRIVAFNKSNPMSMNFDLLRTLVLQKMEEKGWRTLALTSPTPEAGKTVVAINLAMSIAQQTNKTAMLVDLDLRRPKVGAYLGLPMERSLNNLLDGTSELQEVMVNPDMPRLVVLATKTPVRKSAETLSSKKISDLIKELRERYDSRIVIFDLPPVLVADDAITLLPQIDCVLMVVANGRSTKREVEDSIRLIPAESFLGTVFNKAEVVLGDYYY